MRSKTFDGFFFSVIQFLSELFLTFVRESLQMFQAISKIERDDISTSEASHVDFELGRQLGVKKLHRSVPFGLKLLNQQRVRSKRTNFLRV